MDPHADIPPAPLTPLAKRLRNGMFAALALLVALNLFIHPHEPHFGLDAYPGSGRSSAWWVPCCWAVPAKGLAHTVLGRSEDYYERGSAVQGFNGSTVEKSDSHRDATHET